MAGSFRFHTLVAKSFLTSLTPEEQARKTIDGMLSAAGWIIQDRAEASENFREADMPLPFRLFRAVTGKEVRERVAANVLDDLLQPGRRPMPKFFILSEPVHHVRQSQGVHSYPVIYGGDEVEIIMLDRVHYAFEVVNLDYRERSHDDLGAQLDWRQRLSSNAVGPGSLLGPPSGRMARHSSRHADFR